MRAHYLVHAYLSMFPCFLQTLKPHSDPVFIRKRATVEEMTPNLAELKTQSQRGRNPQREVSCPHLRSNRCRLNQVLAAISRLQWNQLSILLAGERNHA